MLQIETKAVSSSAAPPLERGLSDVRAWKISRLVNERGKSATLALGTRQKWEIIHARFQTEDNPRSNLPRKPDLDLYIGANRLLSKFDPEGVLHYAKVLPWEMSPLYPKPLSFTSKLNKTAGHGYIDTPGTVYLEVFVDSPQGCIVLSFSFAGAAVQKTKRPADT